jgi:hypothetical protein
MSRTERGLKQGQAPVRAINALDTIQPTGPLERPHADRHLCRANEFGRASNSTSGLRWHIDHMPRVCALPEISAQSV